MFLEILVEDESTAIALDALLPQILGARGHPHDWIIHAFQGRDDLLPVLQDRLRGYAHWIGEQHRIIVLVDCDDDDCRALLERIGADVALVGLTGQQVLVRIAIEELEAWYFGDIEALREAYPRLPSTLGSDRRYCEPDAIRGGTWEALDRELVRAGYREGLMKTEAARRVTPNMEPTRNRSTSFQKFRLGILRVVGEATFSPGSS